MRRAASSASRSDTRANLDFRRRILDACGVEARTRSIATDWRALASLSPDARVRMATDLGEAGLLQYMETHGWIAGQRSRGGAEALSRPRRATRGRDVNTPGRDVRPHILDDLVTALLAGVGLLRRLRHGLTYLLENARRRMCHAIIALAEAVRGHKDASGASGFGSSG